MVRALFSAGVLVLCAAFTCSAQSSGANPSSQDSSATPPPPAAKDPSKDPAKDSAKDASAPKKHAKKVWTNDEMPSGGGISVVGDSAPSSSSSKHEDSSSSGPREKQVAAYRKQLTQLRTQLDAADRKISELRNFKGDNSAPSGGVVLHRGYAMTPIEDQIKQLEDKKKQIQLQIDDLEDQARKAGIEPGELR